MANIYKGSFVNTQVDYTDNSPNEQTFFLTITDISATGQNLPYNFSFYTDPSVGNNQILLNVSWNGLPTGTTEIIIGYRLVGDTIYTNYSILNPPDPGFYGWLAPFGVYELQIQVITPSGTQYLYVAQPQEYNLQMADAPIVLQTVDNSEDKFTTIKSKSSTIRVFTDEVVNAMTFAGGGDTQYKVQIALNSITEVIFTGWLSISDLGQTFQPDPNVLVLTATDGIQFLRDVPFTDSEDRFVTQNHPLIKYISWALQKTGLELDIWVQMNILEQNAIYDYPEYHFYNYIYLNAQTFEAEIGQLEDSYTVLQKILGEFCELSQQKNVWFIKSIDEANYAQFRICKFNYQGEPYQYITEIYTKDIGADNQLYTMAFMNDDARLSLQRPYKFVEHNYDFEYPAEIIDNLGFERGDLINDTNPLEKIYKFDDWRMIQGVPGFYSVPTSSSTIHRVFNTDDYEIEKYLVITPVTFTPVLEMTKQTYTYAQSNYFYIAQKDKFVASVQWRLKNNISTGSPQGAATQIMVIVINGDDGSWWILGKPTAVATQIDWYNTNNWNVNFTRGQVDVSWNDDLTEWQNLTWTAPPAPVSGKLYIWLHQFNQTPVSNDNVDILYSDLSFEYIPYINGSYQKYSGHQHKSEQIIDSKASRSVSVYMNDSPKKELKGAMTRTLLDQLLYNGNAAFVDGYGVTLDGFLTPYFNVNEYIRITLTNLNNGKYRILNVNYSLITNKTVLTFEETTQAEIITCNIQSYRYDLVDSFYNSILYPGGGVPPQDIYPYGQHQNQAVWNQFNRVFSAFEATVDGLDTDKVDNLGLPDLPDLMHMYRQKDMHPATYNKQFKCLHYEQDTDNCEWSIYMIEVGDGSIPKSYTGHSFKYIQQ